MNNHFNSNGGEQNIAQGKNAIGKQVNYYNTPPPTIPHQLPPLDACFLGRDKELDALLEQLQPGKVAAVCGPGGMGKSAQATQAVSKLEQSRFPDGIIFHSFYHQPSTDMALQTICNAFQVEAKAGLASTVRQVLAGKKALLILDGAEEADDLPALLRLRGGCGVLITSRKRADAQGFRLDLKPLEEQPAAAVFCEHSGAAADDESVAGICKILDGWPVGLRIAGRYCSSTGESAAGYLRWLEQEPFKELGDGEHQEENAALLLRRSVAQVSDDARLALGVAGTLAFAPITYGPVAAILEKNERRARKTLGELVNYGLLETKEERWQVSHALIHTYARKELALSTEEIERMAWFYTSFCRKIRKIGLEGYAFLDNERAHCLRLMESCLERELWQDVQNLAVAIYEYLDRLGYWTELLDACKMNLTAAQQAGDRRNEAACMQNIGSICSRRWEHEKALAWHEQSLLICREIGFKQGEGAAWNSIGLICRHQGKHELALVPYQQSLSIAREIGDRTMEGTILNNIGMVYMIQGKLETALQYYEQSLPVRREAGDKIGEGYTLNNIAEIYSAQGDYAKSLEYNEQGLAIRLELAEVTGIAQSCWSIGFTYENMGDLAKAEEYISLAVQIMEAIGHPQLEVCRDGLAQVRAARQAAQEA